MVNTLQSNEAHFFDEDKFDTYMPASDRELILSELGRYVGKHVVGHAQARMRRKFDTAAFDALEALSLTASLPRSRSGRVPELDCRARLLYTGGVGLYRRHGLLVRGRADGGHGRARGDGRRAG